MHQSCHITRAGDAVGNPGDGDGSSIYDRMVKRQAELKAEVEALLGEAERVDAEEDERFGADRRGDEVPAELARRESRLAKLREAKEVLEAGAR